MSWFNTEGSSPQFYIHSQTRYARSPASLLFEDADGEKATSVLSVIDSLLLKNGFRKELFPPGRSAQIYAFGEKHFIDGDFLDVPCERILYLNEPCSLAVAVGGRDRVVIRAILAGRALSESHNIAAGAEELLDGAVEMAYSDAFGYLSPDPASCGTGASFSVALYLPSLTSCTLRERTRKECAASGILLRPMSLHEGNPGDVYLLSTKASRSCGETVVLSRLESVCDRLVESERQTLLSLFGDRKKQVIDTAWRAFGVLERARQLSESELLLRLSQIRLGRILWESDALPPLPLIALNSLLAEGLDASVVSTFVDLSSEEECREARASMTSQLISTLSVGMSTKDTN